MLAGVVEEKLMCASVISAFSQNTKHLNTINIDMFNAVLTNWLENMNEVIQGHTRVVVVPGFIC